MELNELKTRLADCQLELDQIQARSQQLLQAKTELTQAILSEMRKQQQPAPVEEKVKDAKKK